MYSQSLSITGRSFAKYNGTISIFSRLIYFQISVSVQLEIGNTRMLSPFLILELLIMKQQEAWKEERERGISKMIGLLKFITCGSVDDGKSTLIGHILYDSKLLYTDQEEALELDSKVGSRGGKIDYSLLLDGLMAEREQGITIDVAYRYFTTEKRSFIVADTPGHEEYILHVLVYLLR